MGFCQRRSPISPLAWVSGSKPASKKVDWWAREEYSRSRFGLEGEYSPLRAQGVVKDWNLGEAALSLLRFCSVPPSSRVSTGSETHLRTLFCIRNIKKFKNKENTSGVKAGRIASLSGVHGGRGREETRGERGV